MAGWLRSAGRQLGCLHPSCRGRRPSGSWKLGLTCLGKSGKCASIRQVQDAVTSVNVVQSQAAAAVELRDCPDERWVRGERLEGEQSPREHRAENKRKRRLAATDFLEEQSHEVEQKSLETEASATARWQRSR